MAKQREIIEDQASVGFDLLGYTVVFSLRGIEIESQTLSDLLTPFGWEKLLPDVRTHTRLKRAILRWMREQATTNKETFGVDEKDERGMLRAITSGSTADILAYAIVREKRDLEEWGLSYLTNVRIFYNQPGNNIIVSKQAGSHAMAAYDQALQDSFLPFWERYKEMYVTDDVTRLVPRVIATLQSASMKDGGGTYFVPYEQLANLQQLKDIIDLHLTTAPGQEKSVNFTCIPVIDKPSTKRNMAALAFKAMENEITAMQKDLERFMAEIAAPIRDRTTGEVKTDKDGNIKYARVKEETLKARMKAYGETKAKVMIFKERLGLQESDLVAKLTALETTARTVITTSAQVMSKSEEYEENIEEQEVETAQPF